MKKNTHEGEGNCRKMYKQKHANKLPTQFLEEFIDDDGAIVKKYKSGDYVVCNLSSIHLGRAVTEGALERLISIQVRMLDNVIDINTLPIQQAQLTNQKYRAVGLGTF